MLTYSWTNFKHTDIPSSVLKYPTLYFVQIGFFFKHFSNYNPNFMRFDFFIYDIIWFDMIYDENALNSLNPLLTVPELLKKKKKKKTTNRQVHPRAGRKKEKVLISNWPWSKSVPLDPSWANMPYKKWSDVQTSPLPHTSYIIAYGKGKKIKIWILFLLWSKCIPINLYVIGTSKTFDGKSEEF